MIFETGITGRASGAEDVQRWLHQLLNIKDDPTWIEQIDFKWLFNLKYIWRYDILRNPESVLQTELQSSFGTKDIFAEATLNYVFGKFSNGKESARNGVIASHPIKEFFLMASASYRLVGHNTLIEGSLFNKDDPFTLNATSNVLKGYIGTVYRKKYNTATLKLHIISNETSRSIWHPYLSFAFARSF